ncbi:glycoside hydrolase family 43 protein [Paenibacillus tarimensis]|uniref:glycoside hydrolase family 43 protein n=1 Tax=Paenibacillus tarimensis TaxID=416012 RepID=UPI001F38E36D|nr:glycoside hydrolase family 43 protein [Paenibacillus tarimensis]MCF2945116.1 glycoside hydrolase family 43 protein [Paenibacillus tarimensis]
MKKLAITAVALSLLLSACSSNNSSEVPPTITQEPSYTNVSVHDPSVIKVDDTFYVFGSHLASAKSEDLIEWTQVSDIVRTGNPLIPNVHDELSEALSWAETQTLWAADVIQLADGRYYMYYNACRGDAPLSAMGVAIADNIEGPYKDAGIFLKSGMTEEMSHDGTPYDATKHPNAVDPDTFFDKDGKLWMVYGSYSGGIFILEMDPETGFPLPDQGYGKKLVGGNHSRIEAPYMQYSPETGYYYLFLSYGGLDSFGGYNIRVARSKTPDGPFLDPQGQDMLDSKGAEGSVFDDLSIEPYGAKLMGGYQFEASDGTTAGYVAPGHNSTYYDEEDGEYFIFFHTRFPDGGEFHEVRVHQFFMNADGWPVVAPYRYSGEKLGSYKENQVRGEYQLINHGKDITADVKEPDTITLAKNGKITGDVEGTWKLDGENNAELTIDGVTYKGKFVQGWSEAEEKELTTFTALSDEGVSIWGSRIVTASE